MSASFQHSKCHPAGALATLAQYHPSTSPFWFIFFLLSFSLAIITPDLALGVAPMGAYTVCYLKIASVDCCHEFPPILVYINPVDWGLDWRLLRAKASPPRRALVPYFDRLPACPAFGIKFDGHSCLVNGCTNLGAL